MLRAMHPPLTDYARISSITANQAMPDFLGDLKPRDRTRATKAVIDLDHPPVIALHQADHEPRHLSWQLQLAT
jgi:hypothetical protein